MQHYHPKLILNKSDIEKEEKKFAVVILNRPIEIEKDLVISLWNHSSIKITVDGGTNRWINWLKSNGLEDKLSPPTLITGDLDSCKSESIKYFSKTTEVVQTIDQDETDFTKCLRVLEPFIKELNLDFIVAICENSGRFDHILANVNTLYKNLEKSPEISRPVYLLSSSSLTWLLRVGEHTIYIPENLRNFWCSLAPVGAPSTATTSGLKWNLSDHRMEFGGIVSTSNKYDGKSDRVTIVNDNPVLWSMGIKDED